MRREHIVEHWPEPHHAPAHMARGDGEAESRVESGGGGERVGHGA